MSAICVSIFLSQLSVQSAQLFWYSSAVSSTNDRISNSNHTGSEAGTWHDAICISEFPIMWAVIYATVDAVHSLSCMHVCRTNDISNYTTTTNNNNKTVQGCQVIILLMRVILSFLFPLPHFYCLNWMGCGTRYEPLTTKRFAGRHRGLHECWLLYFQTPRLKSKLNNFRGFLTSVCDHSWTFRTYYSSCGAFSWL